MKKAVAQVALVSLRKESSDRSEMTSQLLFGELVEVLEEKNNWSLVRCFHDGYEGWVDSKQLRGVSDKWAEAYQDNPPPRLNRTAVEVKCSFGEMNLLRGSVLPFLSGETFYLENESFFLSEKNIPSSEEGVSETAMTYINAPYLWGGRSPFGIDCSGFTQVVYQLHGLALPRDAYQQAEQGAQVSSIGKIKSGDLAFFANEEGRIIHVGIVLNSFTIIHASGRVRIDRLDTTGIFNEEIGRYSHKLSVIKRVEE